MDPNANLDRECASESEIKKLAGDVVIDYWIKNRYFDSSEFDKEPIKSFVQYYYQPLMSDYGQAKLMKVRKNYAAKKDYWFGGIEDELEFYTITDSYSYFKNMDIDYYG